MDEVTNHSGSAAGPSTARGLPSRSDDGVDLTLIRWMLSLTPGERLAALQNAVDSILRIRDARSDTGINPTGSFGLQDAAVLPVLRRTLEERDRR